MRLASVNLGVWRPMPALSGLGGTTSVQLTNTSRPGQTFQVGDKFTLVVTGAANQAVTGSGTQNGVSKGTTPYGNTDSAGKFTISGTMTPDTVGTWTEVWTVGGVPSAQLSFTVSQATQTSSAPAPASTSSSTTTQLSPTSTATGGSQDTVPSWFMQSTICCGDGFIVPNWMVLAAIAGAAALWFMSSRGKR
jgi:hypothetical protein